ncbi:MAG TPA: lysozyme [Parvularculaceae bacterium]|nr:lysozyme [Parvularculaceae bacterium]
MKTSSNGIELIKRFEGLELEAYQDIAGIWTIGYGHTGADVKEGMKISQREAEELLKQDLKSREDAVSRLASASLNQNEFDALVSFVYNVGAEAFKNSTARRRLNSGDRVGAAEALTWWNKATVNGVLREVTGLTRRRAAERALFLEPVNPPIVNNNDKVAENSRITPVEDAPRRPNLAESRSIQGAVLTGGAGVAASSIGKDSAEELSSLETDVAEGGGTTVEEAPSDGGDTGAPPTTGGEELAGGGETGEAGTAGDAGASEAAGSTTGGGATGEDAEGVTIFDSIPDHSAEADDTTETTATGAPRPSAHETHAVDAQVQLALMILIIVGVLYIVFARIDDWWRYRR